MSIEELKQELLENGYGEDITNTVIEKLTTATNCWGRLFETERDAEKSIQEVYENWKHKKEKKIAEKSSYLFLHY